MKWMGWLAKLCATVVIVSMLTVLTTGYVVNMYIQSLLDSYNLPLTAKTPTLGGMMKGMLGFGGSKAANETKEDGLESGRQNGNGAGSESDDEAGSKTSGEAGDGVGTGTDTGTGNGAGSGTGSGADNSTGTGSGPDSLTGNGDKRDGDSGEGAVTEPEDTPDGEQPPEDALSVMGGISSGAGSGGRDALGQDQQVLVTPDEMEAKKDGLSDKEKEEVFSMLMSKLPQEEMQKMTEAMEGGLTEAEMIAIEQILSKYLDKAEYAKIIKILQN